MLAAMAAGSRSASEWGDGSARRNVLSLWLGWTLSLFTLIGLAAADPIRVVVWDEQQPQQRLTYTNFIGNHIAGYLKGRPGLSVVSKRLDDPEQGLSADTLDACDVLVWWGHVRQGEISQAKGRELVQRIKAGKLSLIALHSAHWSVPFMEAMNERAREDALRVLTPEERTRVVFHETNQYPVLRVSPKYTDRLTPSAIYRRPPTGPIDITLVLPNCCFPAYRPDAMPGHLRVLMPQHPIVQGLPLEFDVERTEMYDEPFHVPAPDQVVLDERWDKGEWFRSGSVWNLGKGKVFYFRPGHELYPVFHNPTVLKLIENTVRWMGQPQ
jgi:trehalose utilization protein